jgi:hypothetical protein
MLIDIFILLFYFYLVLLSTLGYGVLFSKFFNINYTSSSIGLVGLLGIFFLTFISYLTNLVLIHNFIHNLPILLLGLIFLFYTFSINNKFKKEILKILLISTFYIIGLFISKNNDDFGYYHLATITNLTENKIQFGLANFNSGFGTQSSIFYYISLLYFPIIKYYLFNTHSLLILIFSSIFFLDIFLFKKAVRNNFIKILSLLLFAFINIIFSNIASYGTDRAGQIIVLIIFVTLFELFEKKNFIFSNIKILFVLIFYIFTIKSYFLIYTLLLPLIYWRIKNNFSYNDLLKNFYFIFLLLLYLTLYFFVNIANTGCLIYPLKITCFSGLFWGVPIEYVSTLNHWFELWAKAGATPTYVVHNKIEYIKNFNWVINWFHNYFLGKFIDVMGSIILIITIIFIIFKFSKIKINKKIVPSGFFILYSLLIIFLFTWFNKHPDLRYGGYAIITLIFFIPASIYLSKFEIKYNFKSFTIIFIVFLIIATFNLRNSLRILSEFQRKDPYKFSNFPFYSKHYLESGINYKFMERNVKVINGYKFFYITK